MLEVSPSCGRMFLGHAGCSFRFCFLSKTFYHRRFCLSFLCVRFHFTINLLQILSRKIEKALDNGDLANCLLLDVDKKDSLIYGIIQELISRERKKLDEFKNSVREKYQALNKEDIVDSLYSKKEQLLRLQLFVFTGATW